MVSEYHGRVFEKYNLTRSAWAATTPLDVVGRHYAFLGYDTLEEAKSAMWNRMLGEAPILDLLEHSFVYDTMGRFSYPNVPGFNILYRLDLFPTDQQATAWRTGVRAVLIKHGLYIAGIGGSYYPDGPECFLVDTFFSIWKGDDKPIQSIEVGDWVMSFDASADNGRGALIQRQVTKLFCNTTTEWIKLTWEEDGETRELVATPDHHFLDQFGQFPELHTMIAAGKTTIVLASGALSEVAAEKMIYSAETAHLFEQAHAQGIISGNAALKPAAINAWQTYNFEVDGLHTYVAGGV